jgi:hypothetical protein
MSKPAFCLSFLCLLPVAAAQDQSPLGALVTRVAPSIVTVRVVADLTMPATMGGEKHEMQQEIHGTVVDASGLILVPTASMDPSESLNRMFGDEGKVEATITSLKVVVGNEADELVATVVAKDDKLGFTFVRVDALGDRKLVPLALGDKGELAVGAIGYTVDRLPEAHDFVPLLHRFLVSGRIKKPRTATVVGGSLQVGMPVFDEQGLLCGMAADLSSSMPKENHSMFDHGDRKPMSFIVSVQVVANSVAQAIETVAKAAPDKKDGEGQSGK